MDVKRWWYSCLFLLAGASQAGTELKPDQVIKLKPDEGLVYLAIDQLGPVSSLKLEGKSRSFSSHTFSFAGKMHDDEAYRLVVVKAGDYNVSSVNRFRIEKSEEEDVDGFPTTVQAGKVNYIGRFTIARWWFSVMLQRSNRATADLAELIKRFPKVDLVQTPFVAALQLPDPFAETLNRTPSLVRSDRSIRPDVVPGKALQHSAIDPYFRAIENSQPQLSPDGKMVLYNYSAHGYLGLRLFIPQQQKHMDLLPPSEYSVEEMSWVAPNLIYVRTGGENASHALVRMKEAAGRFSAEIESMSQVVDVIGFSRDGDDVTMIVVRKNISSFDVVRVDALREIDPQIRSAKPLDDGGRGSYGWMLDGKRDVRLVRKQERGADTRTLRYSFLDQSRGRWHDFSLKPEMGDMFMPVGFTEDGKGILVLTNIGLEQTELAVFDPVAGRVSRSVFTRPGSDLQYVRNDFRSGEVIGVGYVEGGQYVTEYFDPASRALQKRISKAFPGQSVLIASRSQDASMVILQVFGARNPGTFYLFDVASEKAVKFLDVRPWLATDKLAPARNFKVRIDDGSEIDAYLTMNPPDPGQRRPLMVLPHGGPFGVFDAGVYDGDAQFFASQGYAVLQVNYRGSGAKGRRFMRAGFRGLGTTIESDIEAAIKVALRDFPLDGERIACVGASYGGYSALMLAIRNPARCKAVVTIAGVSDLPLLYSQVNIGPTHLKFLTEAIGDPASQMSELESRSPDFIADRIKVPVFIAHGSLDTTVSPEHAARLALRLEALDKPFRYQVVEGEGHGFAKLASYRRIYGQVVLFLDQALNGTRPSAEPTKSPETIDIPIEAETR